MNKSLSNLIIAPWTTMVTFTAVRLNLFSIINDKPMTVDEIAAKTDSHIHILESLLRACEGMGFLTYKLGRFGNTSFSKKYLVEGQTQYVGNLIKLQYHEMENWGNLYKFILKNKPTGNSEETDHQIFIKAMNNLGCIGEAEALTDRVDLSNCKRMADFGGGSGLYSIALCQKHPQLQVTLMDKSETLEVTKEYLAGASVKSRIILQKADIVEDILEEEYDAVLLSDVIYDVRIARLVLKNAFNCLKPGGQLIIRGYYSDPGGEDSIFSRLFVLQELVFDPEREVLSMSSLSESVENGGFDIIHRGQLTERSQILIAKKR
jgi:2-polyprenyl-3-methyl-5-hydroxy-6-metoxy-1,4-benzoquinol methylase